MTVQVSGQATILSSSLVEAWILPAVTTDHSVDEHWVDPPEVVAGSVVAGTGFTIYGVFKRRSDAVPAPVRGASPMIYGKWNVAWVWN